MKKLLIGLFLLCCMPCACNKLKIVPGKMDKIKDTDYVLIVHPKEWNISNVQVFIGDIEKYYPNWVMSNLDPEIILKNSSEIVKLFSSAKESLEYCPEGAWIIFVIGNVGHEFTICTDGKVVRWEGHVSAELLEWFKENGIYNEASPRVKINSTGELPPAGMFD